MAVRDQLIVVQRREQIAIRAAAVRQFQELWPIWRGDESSFNTLITAAVPAIQAFHAQSAELAVNYYDVLRRLERPGGSRFVPTPVDLNVDALRISLYTTGRNMTRRALDAGQAPEAAMAAALVRTAGTVTRFTLAGGRDTLVAAVRDDPRADGYERIVSAGACDFCQGLAGSIRTDDFSAHDHCACGVAPAWG